MPRGGARLGAGRPAKPVLQHLHANTYRRDRHGPLPANVLPMPAPAVTWTPDPADLAAQGKAGRVFITRMVDTHNFTVTEGAILLELGHVVSALAAVRGTSRAGKSLIAVSQLERIEMGWLRLFGSFMAMLRVEK